MAKGDAVHSAHTGPNQERTILGAIGTLGTADIPGTALTLPFAIDPDSGAIFTKQIAGTLTAGGGGGTQHNEDDAHVSGNAGNLIFGVRQDTQADFGQDGDYTPLSIDANGLLRTSAAAADPAGGTLDTLGTVGSISDVGAVHTAGTVSALPDLPGGTIDLITAIGVGTVTGIDANAAAQTSRPVAIGGTDSGGTIRTVSVDANGDISFTNTGTVVEVNKGTINLGTTVVSSLPDLPGGTVDLVTAVSLGTSVGAAASGAVAAANPVQIGGTDGGGTVYAMLVDINGNPQVDIVNSPTVSLNDLPGGTVDLVTTVSNLTNGSVRMTVGTVTTGSLTNLATLHSGTVVISANNADLPGGTVDLVTSVTEVANLVKGTVTSVEALPDLPGGTVDLVTGVTTVTNLTSGSVRMTVGTMTTGSLANVAQVHNAGTVQNVNSGTIQIDSLPPRTVIRYGTLGTTAAALRGTLLAPVGAGTSFYLEGYEILQHTGTTDCAIELGTKAVVGGTDTFGRGFYKPGGGVSRGMTNPLKSGANGTITYYMGGAGTAYFAVDYYVVA